MSSLREKLERLNRLKGITQNNDPKNAVQNKIKGKLKIEKEHWPSIEKDIVHFPREICKSSHLEKCIPGFSLNHKSSELLRILRPVSDIWTKYTPFISNFHSSQFLPGFSSICGDYGLPEQWCFVDLETCGFSNCPVFLIGTAYFDSNQLVLEQFFARDYDEESVILKSFWRLISRKPVVVSFNGKRFDIPFVKERTGYWNMKEYPISHHMDLYHISRQFWKGKLPNYKLQTLEKIFCRRSRYGDILGREIPQAYHDYVSDSSKPAAMASAIHHNALDLITLVEIINVLATNEGCIGKY